MPGFDPFSLRRKLLTFPKFQLLVVACNVAVMLVISAISFFWVWKTLSDLKLASGSSGHPGAEFFHSYVDYLTREILMGLGFSVLVGLVGSAVLTLMISHRFAGPLLRLKSFFRSVANSTGPVPRLNFRKNDFLGELPELVNHALDVVERRRGAAMPPSPAPADWKAPEADHEPSLAPVIPLGEGERPTKKKAS